MPKWAKAGPAIANIAAITSNVTCFVFIFSSLFVFFVEAKKAQKKSHEWRRLHGALPSWLKSADWIVWSCDWGFSPRLRPALG
jgi:hypothetical protein